MANEVKALVDVARHWIAVNGILTVAFAELERLDNHEWVREHWPKVDAAIVETLKALIPYEGHGPVADEVLVDLITRGPGNWDATLMMDDAVHSMAAWIARNRPAGGYKLVLVREDV